MKTLKHTLKEISFQVEPASTIEEVAKEVVEYIREWDCVVTFLFNSRLIRADKDSTVQSICDDLYNRETVRYMMINSKNKTQSIMRSFQEQCGAGYPFREIIDNLTDEDICDCFLNWVDETKNIKP